MMVDPVSSQSLNFRQLPRHVVPLLAVLLPLPFLQSLAQLHFLVLLAIAFASMVWLGDLTARWWRLDSLVQSPSLFARALLGQVALVVLWLCLTPLIWAWGQGLGLAHGLSWMVLTVMLGSLALRRQRVLQWIRAPARPSLAWLLIAILALLVLAKAATHYSFRAGALGLDTHQHIAFALDMFNAGYPKLSAGHTQWLEKYPKMLHVLSAVWAWPGFGAHIGPFVKIQPVLQGCLAVFAFVEVLLLWMQRRTVSALLQQMWAATLVVALGYMILRGTNFLYPVSDLNSTGRLAAFSTLLLPALCVMTCWLEPVTARRPWLLAWLMLPLAGAMAAKLNPSLAIAFISFAVPVWFVLVVPRWFSAPGAMGKLVVPFTGLMAGGVTGLLLLLSDPYYLQLLAESVPSVRHFVEQSLHLRLLESHDELISTSTSLGDQLMQVLRWELWYGPQPGWGIQYLPDSTQLAGQRLLPITRALIAATVVLTVAMMTIAPASIRQRRGFGLLIAAQVALLVAAVVALRVSNITTLALGHDTLAASLLSTYTQRYIGLLTMYVVLLHWALLLAQWVMALDALIQWRLPRLLQQRWAKLACVAAAACACLLVVGAMIRVDILGVTPADQGWTFPITEAQVRQFQAAEALLPENAVVLAPAYAIVLNGREDWVLPSLYVTPYLPFSQRDYLFNVRLGSGYGYFAKDLRTMFCRIQFEQTRKILREAGVTHLLAHRWEGQSDAAVLDGQYCLTGYRQLGASEVPVATGPDGLVFYRLDP